MEALKQYLDLYADHGDRLRTGGAALDALRPAALQAVQAWVDRKAPKAAYPEASLESLLAPDYGVNLDRVNFAPNLTATFRCGVPNISTLLGVTVNDCFRPTELMLKQLPEGVTVESLAEAARTGKPAVAEYLNKLAQDSNPAAALNSLLLQDGVLVEVADGVELDKPIQLVNIFNAPTSLIASRRLLVVMGRKSSARLLLCDHTQRRGTDYLSNEVVEIFCGAESHLEIYGINEGSDTTGRISSVYVRQDEGSRLTMCHSHLTGGVCTADMHVDLAGRGAEAHISGLTIADGEQLKTTEVHLRHLVPDCTSRQLFKYALFGSARGAFGGKIVVADGAVRTDAAQTNRNLLAGDNARMASAPQLEIYCDDVKCSHGATTGQLDAAALFYMQTRGIPRDQAQLMLTQAFMADVVDGISYDLIRDRLRQLVERRLAGESASCANCSATDQNCNP